MLDLWTRDAACGLSNVAPAPGTSVQPVPSVEPSGAGLPQGLDGKVRTALISHFKERKFDEGLAAAVQVVLDARGLK